MAATADPRRGAPAQVSLLHADPQFARGIPTADLPLARRVLVLPALTLPAGAWCPPPDDRWRAPTSGLLLVDGLVARRVALADRVATQLLGPGDVVAPWTAGSDLLPCTVSWSVHAPGRAAVLDARLATAARRWPSLEATVRERLGELGDRLATHLAICQLPRVEQRVLALLWLLAERFGRVTPGGVVLPLRLTHRLIGELVGAQRPTVSLALATLLDERHIARHDDGTFVLAEGSWAALEPGEAVPLQRRPTRAERPAATAAAGIRSAKRAGDDGLLERVHVLRTAFGEQRARTSRTLSQAVTLRRERAAAVDRLGRRPRAAAGPEDD